MIPSYLKPYHTDLSNLIRLGRKYDGGYVIDKRVIGKTRVIITCGLEAEWSFEKEFQKYNRDCKILAFDHTVDKNFWINRFVKDFIYLLLLKKIKLGICGEHGGDPKSIAFCSRVGLNYVSCSPYRVPIARLAAAQAEIKK